MIDLKKYQIRVESVLEEKKRVDRAREYGRGDDLDFLFLNDGEEAMIRIIPQAGSDGNGRIAKEVHRYRGLEPRKWISPYHHAGVEDPYHQIREFLFGQCRTYREKFEKQFGKKSSEYETIVEYTKKVWKDAARLNDMVEHYLIVLHYPNPNDFNGFQGPKIFKMSAETYSNLLGIISSPFYSTQPILDFENGRRINVSRQGLKLDTKYTLSVEPNPSPFPKDQSGNLRLDILESSPDLDAIFKPSNVDDMQKFLLEQGMYEFVKIVPQKLEELYQTCLKGGQPPTTQQTSPPVSSLPTPQTQAEEKPAQPAPQAPPSPLPIPEKFEPQAKASETPKISEQNKPTEENQKAKPEAKPEAKQTMSTDELLKDFEAQIEKLKNQAKSQE